MKHNIEPIISQYFSCHQGILATYASHQKRDYDMIFAESWGFKYEKNDYPFGASLHPDYQNRRKSLLEKFHGIKVNNVQYTGKEDLLNLFQLILPYSPIIFFHDVFNCPWNMSYKRNHIDHYILITGLDDKTNDLFVLDPYSTKDENTINIDKIVLSNKYMSYFKTLPLRDLKAEEYLLEINNNLSHIKNSGFFKRFEDFYIDFYARFEEVVLSEYKDVYAIPLVINLRRIANQRYCYCVFLNKMANEKLIDYSMLKEMENIAEKYSLLRVLLIRQIMKKKNGKECADIIKELMNNEYEAYEKMKSFI